MHLPINVKSPNNTSKWQMRFNSAFKGLSLLAPVIHGMITYIQEPLEIGRRGSVRRH
jgi:hypothetical protein